MGPGYRRRLVFTMVGLVVGTAVVVGVVSIVLVERSLRLQLIDDAVTTAEFNLTVLAPAVNLPTNPDRATITRSGLLDRFLTRGTDGVWVELGDGERLSAGRTLPETAASVGLRRIVADGELGYELAETSEGRVLITGGRLPPEGPDFFFVNSAAPVDDAIGRLILVVGGTTVAALAVGGLAATGLARRLVRPVSAAGRAAEQMAAGDLTVRLPVTSNDELGHLSSSFNIMAESLDSTIAELEAARARERRFVADVSHELKTPLTALVNEAALLAQRLEDDPDADEEERTIAHLLNEDVTRLRRLVDDLLEISRLDRDAGPADVAPVDVAAFLAALVAARHPEARIACDLDRPVPTDRRGLERIVGNLLDNARTHAAETSVSASVSNGWLVVEVADRGPGVSGEELTTMFDPFTTLDPSRGSGTGLGLAIASQHARRLGGSILAATRPGGGLLMTVRLPVAQPLHDGDGGATSPRHGGHDPPR